MNDIPRIRMFAGPNGSGKSTFKSLIRPELLGIYINPDEIEKKIRDFGFLDLDHYQVTTTKEELFDFFSQSSLSQTTNLVDAAHHLGFNNGKLGFHKTEVNAYFASVTADFIRSKLLATLKSFTFETVMSFPDKINLLEKAQKKGYRTYLYYVATDDPSINVSRVRNRVKMGGHSVPEDKIVSRYKRSLELLPQAVRFANRSYIFDNSSTGHIWLAEITDGQILDMKTDNLPSWFKESFLNKFNSEK